MSNPTMLRSFMRFSTDHPLMTFEGTSLGHPPYLLRISLVGKALPSDSYRRTLHAPGRAETYLRAGWDQTSEGTVPAD